MNRYLITGAKGMLAYMFQKNPYFSNHSALSHQDFDLTNYQQMREQLILIKPEIVINCSAYTNVTEAEKHPETAFAVNGEGVGNLAKLCREFKIKLIHFSTDFVFEGKNGNYIETDPVKPVNQYGASKLEGEKQIILNCKDFLILRISWLYGPHGKNFVSTIGKLLREKEELKIVNDQFNKTTFTGDVVDSVITLLKLNSNGIFHFANEGICSRYDFTIEIAKIISENEPLKCNIIPILDSEYQDNTPRPINSSMNTEKFKKITGIKINNWQEVLRNYLLEKN